jgi:hypothetical protein
MMKRFLVYTMMVALAVGTSYPASAQASGYTVRIYFYSDASHTTQVGYARPWCTEYEYGATMQWGYSTSYRVEVQGPYCENGELQYAE